MVTLLTYVRQPSLITQVYVVVVEGLTTMEFVVAPVFQEYVAVCEQVNAVIVICCPVQIVVADAEIVAGADAPRIETSSIPTSLPELADPLGMESRENVICVSLIKDVH